MLPTALACQLYSCPAVFMPSCIHAPRFSGIALAGTSSTKKTTTSTKRLVSERKLDFVKEKTAKRGKKSAIDADLPKRHAHLVYIHDKTPEELDAMRGSMTSVPLGDLPSTAKGKGQHGQHKAKKGGAQGNVLPARSPLAKQMVAALAPKPLAHVPQ